MITHNTCMKMIKDLVINDVVFKNNSDSFTYTMFHVWNIEFKIIDMDEIIVLTIMDNKRNFIIIEYVNDEMNNYVLAQQ